MSRSFRILGFLLVLVGFAYAFSLSPSLPDRVPSHWDANGRVNGSIPKPWGVIVIPLAMTFSWLLFLLLPRLSPRGYGMDAFAKAWGVISVSTLAFFLYVEVLTLSAARGTAPLSIGALFGGIGVLFAAIGSVLGRITRNFFAGIRTPWTLANEDVWNRTHRLAGKVFVAAGLVVVALAVAGLSWWLMLAVLILAPLVPIVYSYVIYRRIEGRTA